MASVTITSRILISWQVGSVHGSCHHHSQNIRILLIFLDLGSVYGFCHHHFQNIDPWIFMGSIVYSVCHLVRNMHSEIVYGACHYDVQKVVYGHTWVGSAMAFVTMAFGICMRRSVIDMLSLSTPKTKITHTHHKQLVPRNAVRSCRLAMCSNPMSRNIWMSSNTSCTRPAHL